MNPPAKVYKNRVLAALPKAELNRLTPYLSPVTLPVRTQLMDGHAEHAYFMEEGLASVVLTLAGGATVEVGIIGIDGVVGLPIILGAGTVPGVNARSVILAGTQKTPFLYPRRCVLECVLRAFRLSVG
jgi:hypothetical protein